MNHNVYLPDDVSERAKAAELNLSRLLRDAVIYELERRDAVSDALAETQEYLIENLLDDDDEIYTCRFVGNEIAQSHETGSSVYLTDDERVLVYDAEAQKIHILLDQDDLRFGSRQDRQMYADAARALGMSPIIDL